MFSNLYDSTTEVFKKQIDNKYHMYVVLFDLVTIILLTILRTFASNLVAYESIYSGISLRYSSGGKTEPLLHFISAND